jgi:hypothetical protein
MFLFFVGFSCVVHAKGLSTVTTSFFVLVANGGFYGTGVSVDLDFVEMLVGILFRSARSFYCCLI